MATRKASSPPEDASEVQAAAALMLQREEMRLEERRKRAKRRRQEERKSVQKMHRSIEVIKWCIVCICGVWVTSFIISIVVLVMVHSKVVEIEGQVNRIKHVLENPMASAGARAGALGDKKWKEFWGIPDTQPEDK